MRLTATGMLLGAALALGAFATDAQAGLDFTDTVTANSGSTAGVRFNGLTGAAFGTQVLPPRVPTKSFYPTGSNIVTVTNPGGAFLIPELAVLDYSYTHGLGAFSFANGDGDYDVVVQMGDIFAPFPGALTLSTVRFTEPGGVNSLTHTVNRVLTAADSQSLLFIDIPEATIPATQRDFAETVTLTFIMFDPSVSFGINAVANPEPGTMALFGLGAMGLLGLVRRRKRRRAVAADA